MLGLLLFYLLCYYNYNYILYVPSLYALVLLLIVLYHLLAAYMSVPAILIVRAFRHIGQLALTYTCITLFISGDWDSTSIFYSWLYTYRGETEWKKSVHALWCTYSRSLIIILLYILPCYPHTCIHACISLDSIIIIIIIKLYFFR